MIAHPSNFESAFGRWMDYYPIPSPIDPTVPCLNASFDVNCYVTMKTTIKLHPKRRVFGYTIAMTGG